MINILFQGGWYSGNSAVLDWFTGFEEVLLVKGGVLQRYGEHEFFRKEYGLFDLLAEEDTDKKLKLIDTMSKRAIAAAVRVLGQNILYKTKGPPFVYPYRLLYRYLQSERKKLLKGKPFDEMAHWKKWLDIFSHIGAKKSKASLLVHHNPVWYAETFSKHEKVWPEFFDPFKLIFVYRDPMDQFFDLNNNKDSIPVYGVRFFEGTYHLDAVERYYVINKQNYLARLRMANEYSPEQLIIVSFENFVMNHKSISERLKKFFGILSERDPNNKDFVPEQSMKNIGIGKNNPACQELLKDRPYIMEDLYRLHAEMEALPHTVH